MSKYHTGEVEWNEPNDYAKAQQVRLTDLFRKYGLDLDAYNTKTCCPFPHHQDQGPSFHYYPASNSFFCYGCKEGGGAIQFLINYLQIGYPEALEQLLQYTVDGNVVYQAAQQAQYQQQRQKLLFDFSNYVRKILQQTDPTKLETVEHKVYLFDRWLETELNVLRSETEPHRELNIKSMKYVIKKIMNNL